MKQYIEIIANRLDISNKSVEKTLALLDDGATIPFIARYRKEATGGLDEVEITNINEEYQSLQEIEKRKTTVFAAIEAAGKLTERLKNRITELWDMNELEDIYLPFKPKRRTRATIAKEAGLEPLAQMIMSGSARDIEHEAEKYCNDQIKSSDEAIAGAEDIIAEIVNENETARSITRESFDKRAIITSRVIKSKEAEAANYRDYFEKDFRLNRVPSHALLAMRRGEKEKLLRVKIAVENETVIERIKRYFIGRNISTAQYIEEAIEDGYKRLLEPSIENSTAQNSKETADTEAIRIFAKNLSQLLLSPPLGAKRTMGIDPGFRTGCKVVCLDAQGNLLYNDTIYPHPPQSDVAGAARKIGRLIEQYNIEAIAIGNGTAGRETEQFIQNMRHYREVQVFSVNENGASIYSASDVAREEFPDYDITVRGAVSIARRLIDPLAELVKIDPKSIGVGQYQHDVDQAKLRRALDLTVESCVNSVGVELNSASKQLLTYVAGIGPQIAQNIIDYRKANGAFKSRKELLKVPKLGAKAFEQCAGFIRVAASNNPLDNSAVHPESYHIVNQMAKDVGCSVEELIKSAELRSQINMERYVTDDIGMPTLFDILKELEKPGRDPRQQIKQLEFDPNVRTINDLRIGMKINGIVTNITNFGAFVNIGIKENGLLHISQISRKRINSPSEVLHLNQHLQVTITDVDIERKRIQLSIIEG